MLYHAELAIADEPYKTYRSGSRKKRDEVVQNFLKIVLNISPDIWDIFVWDNEKFEIAYSSLLEKEE